jgi:DNA-binding IclR family transcriptional regulator
MVAGETHPVEAGSVRSVERTLDLLLALEKAGRPMGVTDLGNATGLAKGTAQRLLQVLERRGFVQREDAQWQLGPGLVHLARSFLTESSLTRSAQWVLEDLAMQCGETACLYVRQGMDRVVVHRVEGAHSMRYTTQVGQRMPLLLGAAGLVLAAGMPEDELEEAIARAGVIRLSNGRVRSREEVLALLEEVRLRGVATTREEREAGVASVAAPVLRHGRGTIAAVSVAGLPARMSEETTEHLTVEVRMAARRISENYGRS